ncbi:hypothetical protein H8356DRAFT_1642438 [Neocallimastix lanati (nom. inval.)]|uniref:Uncharacterized protein n=1 Tax=Neocallimastix californiae TaxID=1754190 RepID=A0A1Y2EPV0_9FUNG|nr:hypothetical protein H8356DRAFT_1759965 [Neocallimastix sp. JGI-2020a]KAG4103987.1 hypothetical protein H8356DRAFT_1642438 [Neocallimastix sp. JGI-2020a]ORY73542.1 hypothetical protein LY90DRAFT_699600 [Neocallimastix californiae]|eukprot:ORY73542.1 hypothetical protein LY90DRAFT_699600 [Neocallimastix californiae]
MENDEIIQIILLIIIPWLAIYFKEKTISTNFWICLILWIIGWLPGVCFGVYVLYFANKE